LANVLLQITLALVLELELEPEPALVQEPLQATLYVVLPIATQLAHLLFAARSLDFVETRLIIVVLDAYQTLAPALLRMIPALQLSSFVVQPTEMCPVMIIIAVQ